MRLKKRLDELTCMLEEEAVKLENAIKDAKAALDSKQCS